MSANQQAWNQLQITLEQDLGISAQLLERLQQERESLEKRDYEQFQQIISEKQTLLALLESHIKRRQQWFKDTGFTDQGTALNAAKQYAPKVAKLWLELEQQWKSCQELNEVNERIAKRTRIVVGQILDALRGKTHQHRLYTEKGNTQCNGEGRTISNA